METDFSIKIMINLSLVYSFCSAVPGNFILKYLKQSCNFVSIFAVLHNSTLGSSRTFNLKQYQVIQAKVESDKTLSDSHISVLVANF